MDLAKKLVEHEHKMAELSGELRFVARKSACSCARVHVSERVVDTDARLPEQEDNGRKGLSNSSLQRCSSYFT